MKNKKYIPQKNLNPAKQKLIYETSIEIINKEHDANIEKFNKALEALSKSFDTHISYLGNFARHDIKNSIQSMDSILTTNKFNEVTEEHLTSLKVNLKVIRVTLDNFSKLVPYSQDEKFTLHDLYTAIELLNRSSFYEKRIEFLKDYPEELEYKFNLPFQSILQLLNNLIINSLKSIEDIEVPKIKLKTIITDDELLIEIFDNGSVIDITNVSKIFDFGYSTTGGSGIGLFHAKFFCDQFKGTIELKSSENSNFTKSFLITLPIIKE